MHVAARPCPRKTLLAGGAALLLAGCIVVPRSTEVYDPACRAYVKQMVLEAEVIGAIGHCSNDGCAVMLASMGIVSAASAVVSGSVAVIGNIVYWAERQGRCPTAEAPPPAPAASAPLPPPPVVPGLVPAPGA